MCLVLGCLTAPLRLFATVPPHRYQSPVETEGWGASLSHPIVRLVQLVGTIVLVGLVSRRRSSFGCVVGPSHTPPQTCRVSNGCVAATIPSQLLVACVPTPDILLSWSRTAALRYSSPPETLPLVGFRPENRSPPETTATPPFHFHRYEFATSALVLLHTFSSGFSRAVRFATNSTNPSSSSSRVGR